MTLKQLTGIAIFHTLFGNNNKSSDKRNDDREHISGITQHSFHTIGYVRTVPNSKKINRDLGSNPHSNTFHSWFDSLNFFLSYVTSRNASYRLTSDFFFEHVQLHVLLPIMISLDVFFSELNRFFNPFLTSFRFFGV